VIREQQIALAALTVDLHALITRLTTIDDEALRQRLEQVRRLIDELSSTARDAEHQHDVIERLGHELDAARRVLRPQFNR
jgi:hypothetical protein